MNGLFQQLFTLVVVYGYPVVALSEIASSIGAPVPMTPILLLAGSLSAIGTLDLPVLILVVACSAVLGDSAVYFIGRKIGVAAAGGAGRHRFLGYLEKPAAKRAQAYLAKWSGMGIFLSRWLFTPVCAVMSIVAGVSLYPVRKFLVAAVAGELLAAVLYVDLGYLVGASWPEIWDFLSGIPGLATGAALGLLLVGFGLARLVRKRGR